MEFLLNLFWLMLAVPALLLSLRARRLAHESGQVWRTNSLVLVVCLLLLLFPVISATDDLLALGLDMEESSPTKSLVKQSAGAKSPVAGHHAGATAQLPGIVSYAPNDELHRAVSARAAVPTKYDPVSTSGCRAPPCPKSSASFAPSRTAQLSIFKLDFILQSGVVMNAGSQAEPPQASVAPDGLRRFKCRTHHLIASGSFPIASRNRTQSRRQSPRDPTYQLPGEDESS